MCKEEVVEEEIEESPIPIPKDMDMHETCKKEIYYCHDTIRLNRSIVLIDAFLELFYHFVVRDEIISQVINIIFVFCLRVDWDIPNLSCIEPLFI